MSDNKFVDGFLVKKPRDGAPSFLKCAISIKREDLIKWLSAQSGEWINLDVKESKGGNWYAAVNDWKPDGGKSKPAQSRPTPVDSDYDDSGPF